jgi:DNA polymerase III subunit chi
VTKPSPVSQRPTVEFRTGIRDKVGYAHRWLRLAIERGARVRVLAGEGELRALGQALWVADKESFLPHAFAGAKSAAAAGLERTRIWLGPGAVAGAEPELLLNLGSTLPLEPLGYLRIIEVVSVDDAEVQAGRDRWAAYRKLGLEPAHRKADEEA